MKNGKIEGRRERMRLHDGPYQLGKVRSMAGRVFREGKIFAMTQICKR